MYLCGSSFKYLFFCNFSFVCLCMKYLLNVDRPSLWHWGHERKLKLTVVVSVCVCICVFLPVGFFAAGRGHGGEEEEGNPSSISH